MTCATTHRPANRHGGGAWVHRAQPHLGRTWLSRTPGRGGGEPGPAQPRGLRHLPREDVHKLRKHAVGLGGVLFLTVTGSAPISAMLFNTPIVVGYGQGVGAPAAFMVATVVLVIFSVGYVAMARKKTTAGGFYSYISHGLGRELGIGTGFGSVVAYSVFEASLCGGFAYFLSLKLTQFGVNIAWPWLALSWCALISVLTYFDVRLSTAVLAVGLITEVVILLIFDVVMFLHGHIQLRRDQPGQRVQGLPGARASSRRARSASGCSSPSGPGSASRWPRTTARSPATRSGSCRGRCTSR